MSLSGNLHKLRSRSPAERRCLLAALLRLAWAWTLIRTLSFQKIAQRLHMATGEGFAPLTSEQLATAARVGAAVASAALRTPWRSACLEQALAAAGLLQRAGIPGTLYLGVAREQTQTHRIAAHAWLRCGDLIVTGAGGHERFVVVGRYYW
jgi:hypothetical protein